ncbi:MAG: uroporphyrinogen-III synthase [Pseudomonadales bacterium]|nr:uroporphyrinogen-III synthase [Pseudomonadales bacterium]
MNKTVLLTRSNGKNTLLAELLAVKTPVKFSLLSRPLLSYRQAVVDASSKYHIVNFDRYDTTIFTSQNAVEFGLSQIEVYWPQWPESMDWLAVGPATVAALERWGVEALSPSQLASSEGLLQLNVLQAPLNSRVLIVRGVGGRELLRDQLLHRGAEVHYLEVYRREPVQYNEGFCALLKGEVAAAVYSVTALLRLVQLIGNEISRFRLVVPSQRIQSVAFESGFDKVDLAASQVDDDMSDALARAIAKGNH